MVRAAFEDVASEPDLAVRLRQSRTLLEDTRTIGQETLTHAFWEARWEGYSWSQIATMAGYAPSGARTVRDRVYAYARVKGLRVPRRRLTAQQAPVESFDARIRAQRESAPQGAIRSRHRR